MVTNQESYLSSGQWQEISRGFQAPFNPPDVEFRVQGRVSEQSNRAQVVAYIDARVVQDRLDQVVGPGNWSFDWEPVLIEKGQVMLAKGTLTVLGVAKSDIGSASNFEQSLGCVSHAFKRAAVHWGIGRYLYALPATWVSVEKGGRISDQLIASLRSKLPVPDMPRPSENSEVSELVDAPVDRRAAGAKRAAPSAASAAPRRQSVIREAPIAEPVAEAASAASAEPPATEQQLVSIRKLSEALRQPTPDGALSYAQARQLITQLSAEYQKMRRAS